MKTAVWALNRPFCGFLVMFSVLDISKYVLELETAYNCDQGSEGQPCFSWASARVAMDLA
jgi:hypothetical protein